MPYTKIDPSGCLIKRGLIQLRLSFYLQPSDVRYDEHHIPLIDKDGNPTGEFQDNPFHNHFIYVDKDITGQRIKEQANFHLLNFYTAWQQNLDRIPGGMRKGWATETRIRPKWRDDVDQASLSAKLKSLLKTKIDRADLSGGRLFPSTEIDIGADAINRATGYGAGYTIVAIANPANDTCPIDTVEIWGLAYDLTNCKAGTFSGAGTSYDDRDYEILGTVTKNSKQTFSGLDIDAVTGDYIGTYFEGFGSIEATASGGSNIYVKVGDQFGGGSQTYTLLSGYDISLYGTGETAVTFIPTVTII